MIVTRAQPTAKHSSGLAVLRGNSRRWLQQYGLVLALLVIGGVLTFLTPHFLTGPNLINVLRQISINGILAVGVTFVLLTGGVDLSLGSMVALSGVVAACFAHPGAYPWWIAVMLGRDAGGAANGVMVAWGRVAPFVTTLGMMTVARGLALVVSKGRPVSNLNHQFTWLGGGDVLGLPFPVLLLFGVALAAFVILRNLRLGRYIYAVGDSERTARAAGLNVERVKLFAYTVCGGLAGLAGVVLAARITTGQPNAGVAYELDAIAAAVIGGTSLSGGVGGVGGTILGALLIGVINNGLDLLNVSSYYQQIVKGLIIVGAVWLDKGVEK